MIILPAIDIVGGRAVRLLHGDYEKETVYGNSPLAVAQGFEKAGAGWLHVVDLDGAKDGDMPNFEVICEIIKSTSLSVEVGGGVRTMEAAGAYLDAGAKRVILGTAAVEDKDFLSLAVRTYGDLIAVGADFRGGKIMTRGWKASSGTSLEDFLFEVQNIGVSTAIITDISRDGALSGTSRDVYSALAQKIHMNIIASGGISSLDDIIFLRDTGIYGAVVGRAVYTGDISLPMALECYEGEVR